MFASYTLEGVGYIVAGTFLVAAIDHSSRAGLLVVTPLLHNGYHQALILADVVVLGAATAAAVLRIGFPHHMPPVRNVAPARQSALAETTRIQTELPPD